MNRSKRKFVSILIGCLAPLSSIAYALGVDDTSASSFKIQLDALMSIHPRSIDDLKPALAFIKSHEKDVDLESEMKRSDFFVKIEPSVRYYFNPNKYGRNTCFSIESFLMYVFYDSTNRELIDNSSFVMSKKTQQDFEIRRN